MKYFKPFLPQEDLLDIKIFSIHASFMLFRHIQTNGTFAFQFQYHQILENHLLINILEKNIFLYFISLFLSVEH